MAGSEVEDREISNVWEYTWYLPFQINPLGDLSNQATWHHAANAWRFVRDEPNRGGLVAGARAFPPIRILRHEWDEMLEDSKMNPEAFEDLF
jgi:hypothetical protein